MTNWIRSWGIVLFAMATLIWLLSVDWLVKRAIVTYGTELNGAQVELESADLSLWPAGLELTNLQVTDAYHPMFNSFEASKISATLDSALLLRRQVIVEQLDVIGVRMNSPRVRSGATNDQPIAGNAGFNFLAALSLICHSQIWTHWWLRHSNRLALKSLKLRKR